MFLLTFEVGDTHRVAQASEQKNTVSQIGANRERGERLLPSLAREWNTKSVMKCDEKRDYDFGRQLNMTTGVIKRCTSLFFSVVSEFEIVFYGLCFSFFCLFSDRTRYRTRKNNFDFCLDESLFHRVVSLYKRQRRSSLRPWSFSELFDARYDVTPPRTSSFIRFHYFCSWWRRHPGNTVFHDEYY